MIVVTGGAGFVGRHVVALLTGTGRDVRVLDSLRSDVHRDGLVRGTRPDGVELVVGDVRDPAALDLALRGADAVVHLAAKVGLGVGVADLPDYASSNDHGTACLLAAMERAGVGRLVLASSMVVYGEGLGHCALHGAVRPGPRPLAALHAGHFEAPCPRCGADLGPLLVDEDAPADPRNAYAASKLAQEHLAAAWSRATGGAVTTLRLHNVYGPGLPVDTPYAGVAAIWLSQLRAGHSPRVFEDGRQRRDFVHVRDVAQAVRGALVRAEEGVRAYNVGSGRVRTIGEFAGALAAAVGGVDGLAPVVTGEFRAGDVRHITADSGRLRREFDLPAPVDLLVGVRDLAESTSSARRRPDHR